jgi:hypothetical protein
MVMTRSYDWRCEAACLMAARMRTCAAAADIPRHRRVDVGVVGVGGGREQGGRRHDLSGLAIAALDHFQIEPGLLHLRADRRSANALDGGDGAVAHRADRQHAGAHRLAVDMHGTRSALGNAAAELGSGHAEHVTQHPKQRHVRGHVE